ncbi:hypothetical protein TL16_g10561 [Triparma laevis f. inornata]|uniref:Uncharacterized protein n=2 Tax=Triparma laevis TaxID=1534972 RepID=A0A9W6ZZC6_9STRA|nr:hypothetical protein TrLO_g6387 [Triparma laevis f. longispina]GMH86490.1 hypothetical protein TL16_g10561 [Triparma laevis f. inornata]
MSAVSAAPLSSLTGGQISSVVSSCSAFLMTPSSGLDLFQQSLTALALPGKQTKTIGKVLLTMLPALVASTAGMDEGGVKGEVKKVGAEIGEWGRQDFINSLCSAVKQLKEFKTRGGQLITYDSTGESSTGTFVNTASNKLDSMTWTFGVTASNDMLDQVGKTYLRVDFGGEVVEMDVNGVYKLMGELERARGIMEVIENDE